MLGDIKNLKRVVYLEAVPNTVVLRATHFKEPCKVESVACTASAVGCSYRSGYVLGL